ncbi:MAG: caspase family protein [Leptospiraceae bacterium]|nr:caspase family protein [Leptospiraceae bacterium]MCP5496774.1 caspase family protein [Leptospiraceae bacterium]
MRKIVFYSALLLFSFSLLAESGINHAIIIGIGRYHYGEYKNIPLHYPQNEANNLTATLSKYGKPTTITYKMTDIMNTDSAYYPRKDNVLALLESILETASENDSILIFFSGHGKNGSLALTDTHILLKQIINHLDKSKIKGYTLLIDTFRKGVDQEISKWPSLNSEQANKTRTLLYATPPSKCSCEDHSSSMGKFAKHLVEGLNGEADYDTDNKVTNSEISKYIFDKLKYEQIPLSYIKGKGSIDLTEFRTFAYPKPPSIQWYKALVPGYVQWEKGEKLKASAITTASFLAIGYYQVYNRYYPTSPYNRTYTKYENANQAFGLYNFNSPQTNDPGNLYLLNYRTNAENNVSKVESGERNLSIGLFSLIYLFNVYDGLTTLNENNGRISTNDYPTKHWTIGLDYRSYGKANLGERCLNISYSFKF